MQDNRCRPLEWAEITGWAGATGRSPTAIEYSILKRMDVAYCEAMNVEITYSLGVQRERAEQEAKRHK